MLRLPSLYFTDCQAISFRPDHEHIYTDGSKDEVKVGCAAAKYDDGSSVFFFFFDSV